MAKYCNSVFKSERKLEYFTKRMLHITASQLLIESFRGILQKKIVTVSEFLILKWYSQQAV